MRLWGKAFPASIDHHDPTIVTIKNDFAAIPDSPLVFVEYITADAVKCRITLTGMGTHAIRLISRDVKAKLAPSGSDGPTLGGSDIVVTKAGRNW